MKCWYEHVCLKVTWYYKRIQMYCKSDIDSMKALKLSTHLSKTRHPIYCFCWSEVGTNQVIININYVVLFFYYSLILLGLFLLVVQIDQWTVGHSLFYIFFPTFETNSTILILVFFFYCVWTISFLQQCFKYP